MNKNLWLAVGLSMMVYGAWLIWIAKTTPVEMPEGAARVATSTATVTATALPSRGLRPPAGSTPLSAGPGSAGRGETRLLGWEAGGAQLRFATKGGALAGYVFRDVSGPVELLPLESSGFFATWPDLEFQPAASLPGRFALEAEHPSGIRLRKEFAWTGPGGIQTLRLTASNPGHRAVRLESWRLTLGPGLGTVASELTENPKNLRAVASYQEPPRKSPTVKKLKPGEYEQAWNWVGVDNRYFLAAVFLDAKEFPTLTVREAHLSEQAVPFLELAAAPAELGPGQSRTWEIPFYLGAKDYVALRAMGRGLDGAVDFGWFGGLGKLTFRALRALYRVVGNYGVAIILLTLVLQCLMLPMTLKSLKTSLMMQKLQPKIQEVQKKFADDPKRMNVEMMELYKSSGTNPLGGCLPLLAQLPIFWALFTMLRNCWELHGAPFALWIRDLSAHDPFHVLPLIMGGLMFVQQRMNPAAGDPAQQKVFMFMPVLFTFMFWNFPSGLVLYWMVSSLFGLTQQFLFKRYSQA